MSTPNSILHFINAENISDNVAPASAISGPDTLLSAPQHIFLDTADDRLYVANQGGGSILVFDKVSSLNGDVIPTRVISGNATLAATATGNVAPVAEIAGSNTLLQFPGQITLNSASSELFVLDSLRGSILIFADIDIANGNISPARTISGPATGFTANAVNGLAIDFTR